jgi:site-specific recombinase XerD
MTPLRQRMIGAMRQRGFSDRTQQSYLYAVIQLSRYFNRSPDQLSLTDIQRFFEYLVQQKHLTHASCRLHLHALRFLYLQVLHWSQFDMPVPLPKAAQRIPELLTRHEVASLINACDNPKHRTMLLTGYGCGLRVSELVALKLRDIDGERHLLRVEQGKGRKDRLVALGEGLLQALRRYWQQLRPRFWLFPSASFPERALGVSSIQRAYRRAKQRAGIDKRGGIHALRHAYATHQLENGLAVHRLQQQLGHRHLTTTLRYVHWVASYQSGSGDFSDLVAALDQDHG